MKIAKTAVGTSLVLFFAAAIALWVLAAGTEPRSEGELSRPPGEAPPAPPEKETVQAPSGLTRDEVAKHNHAQDCWLIIRGGVYDVTGYIERHPAPRRTITDYCGKESTPAFETKEHLNRPHRPASWRLLERYRVGDLAE